MALSLAVIAKDSRREKKWIHEIQSALKGWIDVDVTNSPRSEGVVLLDAEGSNLNQELSQLSRDQQEVWLVIDEKAEIPELWLEGKVDGILIHPFRALELMSKLQDLEQRMLWKELSRLNSSFSDLLVQIQEDLNLATRLQKAKLPKRFPKIQGLTIASRYLVGMKSGGDYFDIIESQQPGQVSIVLTNSSSYGLSSAVLGVLMKVAMKLTSDSMLGEGALLATVRRIYDEILLTLGEKDEVALFLGTLSLKDLSLRFLNFGNFAVYYSGTEGKIVQAKGGVAPLTRQKRLPSVAEEKVQLHPGSRVLFVSKGFTDVVGGDDSMQIFAQKFKEKEAADILNELAFQVKSKLIDPESMPERDCTAIVLETAPHVIQLSKRGRGGSSI